MSSLMDKLSDIAKNTGYGILIMIGVAIFLVKLLD